MEPEELGDGVVEVEDGVEELPVPAEVVLFTYAVELVIEIAGAVRVTVVNAVDAPGFVTVTITVLGS